MLFRRHPKFDISVQLKLQLWQGNNRMADKRGKNTKSNKSPFVKGGRKRREKPSKLNQLIEK